MSTFLSRAKAGRERTSRASKTAGAPEQFDLVFLDPPYDAGMDYATVLGLLGGLDSASQDRNRVPARPHPLLAADAIVIAEHRRKQPLDNRIEASYGALVRVRLLDQGDAALSFYAVPAPG